MSIEKSESLNFYKYLCQEIGSEEVVRMRRLVSTVNNIGEPYEKTITSGSLGEGLHLKGSDIDIMIIESYFKVYESEKEVVLEDHNTPLIMNTEETQPCFAQLYLPKHWDIFYDCTNVFQKHHMGWVLSSELYKKYYMSLYPSRFPIAKIHGPCLSDIDEQLDLAYCIQSDKWIFQAQSWVSRPRTTWPPPELISKIVSCGVLFVPIGCKGSINKHHEWRISFSVAEKFLIFSFSHTQLLCYALLKILLKEIIDKHTDLKGLLCSYFLKTLMLRISEEIDPSLWRPDNIIPCFMVCLQRLLYCVKYSVLTHYFISDNNLFNIRFNANNKDKMTTILNILYKPGVNCFAASETLQDYQNQAYKIPENVRFMQKIITTLSTFQSIGRLESLLYNFLHHSRTSLSKGLFALQLARACSFTPDAKYLYCSENKLQYSMYKYVLSHLLIGLHSDAVSGWLMLASFFYAHENYFASLTVIHNTLQKYTDEKIYTVPFNSMNLPGLRKTLNPIQKNVLNLMKKEKLYTILKALTIYDVNFFSNSSVIPQVLQLDLRSKLISYHPLSFANFLCFLCNYHLHDITSCNDYLQQLHHFYSIKENLMSTPIGYIQAAMIFGGIAYQLLGNNNMARQLFQVIAEYDEYNVTSAAIRLYRLT